MNTTQNQKEKYGNVNSNMNSNEGTSARTRAFSFEQIMSRRRRNRMPVGDAEGEDLVSKVLSKKSDYKFPTDRTGYDGGNNLKKDSKSVMGNSISKEEVIPNKKTSPRKHKDKMHHDSEANMKAKSTHAKSSRDKESRKDRESHRRSRGDDKSKFVSEKESSKRPSRDAQVKDKHEGEDGKSLRTNKRKSLTGSDEKSRREMDGFAPKKHDSSNRRDLEPLERRKSQRYDEPRLKRRRSKSRENDRGRDGESVSISPRVHKRSFHGRDHVEPSSRSFKDRPGRQYSDADRYRPSGSGGYESGRYRRHGSGLGGYSPRKRRTEVAAVKIPSPTTRSPERKGATWDLPPAGVNHSSSGSMPGNQQLSSQNVPDQLPSVPDTPTKVKTQWTPSSSAVPTISFASIDSVHLTQATRPMRRLYIENLPSSATEKSIIICLNDFLQSTGANHIPGTHPCISCIINKEKCQAVVEFLTPEDATAALSFDGKSFSGSTLKLRRPKDFIDAAPTTGAPEKPAAVINKPVVTVNAISDVVKDTPQKIFIGGISELLSSDMLLEIVSVFGLVKAYHFEFNVELNQPCAFLEYVDQSVTQTACAGLNGMRLGGDVLTVVRTLHDNHLGEDSTEKPPFYGVPDHARPLLENPTQVLKLNNVFDQENFLQLSEAELVEILEDIRLECGRFGTVKSVNVVRYMNNDNDTSKDAQDLIDESGKMEPRKDIIGCDINRSSEQVPLDDVKKSPDIGEVSRNTETIVENIDNDNEIKDSNQSAQLTTDVILEEPPVPEAAAGEQGSDSEAVKLEGGHGKENLAGTENPKQVHVSTDSRKCLIELDLALPEESDAGVEGGTTPQGPDHVFEPACVLVEFLRKEATCAAAHCLNGRSYFGRLVAASYTAHDLYLEHFPR